MSIHRLLRRGGRREGLYSTAAWNIAGTLVYTGCQWGVLVSTVRIMTPSEVGSLSLGFAITAPIFLFLQLRLRSASATDVGDRFHPSDYISLRAATTLLAFLISFAVCLVFHLQAHEMAIVLCVASAKALESGSDLFYGFSQKANDLRIVSISMIARGTLSLLVFPPLLFVTHSLCLALAGLCAAWGLVLAVIDAPYGLAALKPSGRSLLSFPRRNPAVASLIRSTFPLGVSSMLMSLCSNMPRYFIARQLGASDLGIFAAMGYLAMAASVIVSALAESSITAMARHISAGDLTAARALLRTVIAITLCLSLASIVVSSAFGQQIIRLIYGPSYTSAANLLTGMMVVAGIANLASVLGYALVAGRCYIGYLHSLFALTFSIIAACAICIPLWGLRGAVLACILGYSLQVIWSYRKAQAMLAPAALLVPPTTVLS